MPRRLIFGTLPPELEQCAHAVAALLRTRGYGLRAEHHEIGYPSAPTLEARRKPIILFVEVVDLNSPTSTGAGPTTTGAGNRKPLAAIMKRVNDWVAYCTSAGSDARFALAMPEEAAPPAPELGRLQELGVGLYLVVGAGNAREAIAPSDLGMHGAGATLPKQADLPATVRALLGTAYDKIAANDWREAFKEGCFAIEHEARRYFKHWSKSKRIKVLRKAVLVVLSPKQIDKLTMGKLADAFAAIASPTALDAQLGQTLSAILKDRNLAVHKMRHANTEARLRRNWRAHFWKIVDALKAIHV